MQSSLFSGRIVVVAAHPDDETIGAGALLPYLKDVRVIHTTDGSPRDPGDARRSGFETREAYRDARRAELACALEIAGVPGDHAIELGYTDQESMHILPELTLRIHRLLCELRPDTVMTHPYEGGHPDHDSTAFAVHQAVRNLQSFKPTQLVEFTSYHLLDGRLQAGEFLPNGDQPFTFGMSGDDRENKSRMLACFASQSETLRNFPVIPELFRRAPHYDFEGPPHPGSLHYEILPWGITGEAWRAAALGAAKRLPALPCP